jgi:outer membrane protein assembly factor BamB
MRHQLLAALIALCVADAVQAQSMFRGGETHSGVYPSQGPREFHRVKWIFPTGGRVVSSPVSDGSAIYFGSDDANVYAVDAKTGKQVWQHTTGGPVSGSGSVVDGTLYIMSYDGKLYALDSHSGATKWKFTTAGERHFEAKNLHGILPKTQTIADPFDTYLSSPVVAKGVVYFGSGDNNLYAVDAASGELRWKFATGDVVHASPAYADGVVYVGSWDSYFYAVDATTGKEKWRLPTGEDAMVHNQVGFQSSPAVVNGVVYTGCRDANLYAIDAATGKEKWHVNETGSWVITSPAVARGKVIFGTSDSSKYQIADADTGKLIAEEQGKAYLFSSPAIAGDVVFVGVLNGTLEARDFDTGKLLWEFQTEASKRNLGWTLTADRKFNATMLFTSSWEQAFLASFERETSVGSIFSSPLVLGGAVYFGSTDGNVYALE